MKVAMKVLFFTQSNEICAASRTRVYHYLPFLEDAGISYKVIAMVTGFMYKGAFIPSQNTLRKLVYIIFSLLFNYIKSFYILLLAPYYDVIFIQRVMMPKIIGRALKRINSNIVFDFDDAIFAIESDERNLINRLRVSRNRQCLPFMLSISKIAILENEYNRRFAQQYIKDIRIITGPIDTERYQPKNKNVSGGRSENITIGWIGSASTTMYLDSLKSVFKALFKKYKCTLKLIGAANFDIPDINIVHIKWDLNTEVRQLCSFDIGIMPLPDDEWTRGKGGYKLLQYLAMGIPAVSTPVGINNEIIQDGVNGFLVNSEKEWIEKLSVLIENDDIRERFGSSGRRLVEERYSVKASAPRLLEVLYNAQKDRA